MEFSILVHCGEIDQVAYDIMDRISGKKLKEVCTLKGVWGTNEFIQAHLYEELWKKKSRPETIFKLAAYQGLLSKVGQSHNPGESAIT